MSFNWKCRYCGAVDDSENTWTGRYDCNTGDVMQEEHKCRTCKTFVWVLL